MLAERDVMAVLERQTSVMEQLASDAPLAQVLDSIVLALEALIPGSRCSVLLLDDEGVLRHGSAPNLPISYSTAIDGLAPGPLAGSCGSAVHLGEPAFAQDVTIDPRWLDFRELAETHDIGACWSNPIRARSHIVGTFAVYHRTRHKPDEREMDLVRRFTHLASIAVDHDQAAHRRLARLASDLKKKASTDHLTGLANRSALSDDLNSTLASQSDFSLLLLDMDDFKSVNDTFGHAIGDELLQSVAERLNESTSQDCTVARMGGDEFVIIAPNSTEADATALATLIIDTIGEPFALRGATIRRTCSVGIALSVGSDDATSILLRADKAAYAAKHAGRSNFRLEHSCEDSS